MTYNNTTDDGDETEYEEFLAWREQKRRAEDASLGEWHSANGAALSRTPGDAPSTPPPDGVRDMNVAYDDVIARGGKREDAFAAGLHALLASDDPRTYVDPTQVPKR